MVVEWGGLKGRELGATSNESRTILRKQFLVAGSSEEGNPREGLFIREGKHVPLRTMYKRTEVISTPSGSSVTRGFLKYLGVVWKYKHWLGWQDAPHPHPPAHSCWRAFSQNSSGPTHLPPVAVETKTQPLFCRSCQP